MPSCPFCQTELSDDFGLIECPNCEASLFIEMDGSVKANSDQQPDQSLDQDLNEPLYDEAATPENEFFQEDNEFQAAGEPQADGLPADEFQDESVLQEEVAPQEESVSQEEIALREESASQDEGVHQENIYNEFEQSPGDEASSLEDFSSDLGSASAPDSEANSLFDPDSPIDSDPALQVPPLVSDNLGATDLSELATAIDQEGSIEGIHYDVRISGIDTAELRRDVFDSLTDKRMGWDIDELMSRIEKGCLELKGISAVKAHIIVQRLKSMPLQIRWEQHADS